MERVKNFLPIYLSYQFLHNLQPFYYGEKKVKIFDLKKRNNKKQKTKKQKKKKNTHTQKQKKKTHTHTQ